MGPQQRIEFLRALARTVPHGLLEPYFKLVLAIDSDVYEAGETGTFDYTDAHHIVRRTHPKLEQSIVADRVLLKLRDHDLVRYRRKGSPVTVVFIDPFTSPVTYAAKWAKEI